jgi:ribosomal protein L40E
MQGKITSLLVLLSIFAGYVTVSLFSLLGIPMTFAIVYAYSRWLRKAFLDDDNSSCSSNKVGIRYGSEQHKHLSQSQRFSPFKYRCARCKALIPVVAVECNRCGSKQRYAEF